MGVTVEVATASAEGFVFELDNGGKEVSGCWELVLATDDLDDA